MRPARTKFRHLFANYRKSTPPCRPAKSPRHVTQVVGRRPVACRKSPAAQTPSCGRAGGKKPSSVPRRQDGTPTGTGSSCSSSQPEREAESSASSSASGAANSGSAPPRSSPSPRPAKMALANRKLPVRRRPPLRRAPRRGRPDLSSRRPSACSNRSAAAGAAGGTRRTEGCILTTPATSHGGCESMCLPRPARSSHDAGGVCRCRGSSVCRPRRPRSPASSVNRSGSRAMAARANLP